MERMSSEQRMESTQTPNSDIVNLPAAPKDVQEGVQPLTPAEQVPQLSDYFEDNYPELFQSLTTDEGASFREQGLAVPAELIAETEGRWARFPDLLTHASLLVLGAGLDHRMPHVAQLSAGTNVQNWADYSSDLPSLPEGVTARIITPSNPTGNLAISIHGGPGWFGDGASHDFLWLPLFAAIAEQSGATIVDLTFPLPGQNQWSWKPAQEAVDTACETIVGASDALHCDTSNPALVTFGSGILAAETAARRFDRFLFMTPRVPSEGFAQALPGASVLLSLATQDTRADDESDIRAYFDATEAKVQYDLNESEHLIAAPAVWRERVAKAADWLRSSYLGRS
ncbi:hypothetical protein CRES_0318 [Corynebacterium resistens DSM 45100]|uniref:Alpha/beta hydrolase n=2 Tax=Corynebacterium resistens TaxID=258224 RepID=F8E2Y3_CORRG|nr:hypothetical protein CRES_0318 [Corynebacterium resistens DSM 45100]